MSEFSSEESELSAVREMSVLMHEVADLKTRSTNWKERVTAAHRALGFTWNRTKDFYFADARISPRMKEGDHARKVRDELKAKREAYEQAVRLHEAATYLRQSDEDFHQPTVDALERAAAAGGVLGGSMASPD